MTQRSKSALSSQEANDLIAEVEASDRAAARKAIAQGVQAAQAQWIEAPLIAEALALELIAVAEVAQHSRLITANLRKLADALEARADLH